MQKCVQNRLVVFVLLAALRSIVAALDERISVRDFSLVTDKGENILHESFNRRRLADGSRRLTLTFRAADLDVSSCLYLLCYAVITVSR